MSILSTGCTQQLATARLDDGPLLVAVHDPRARNASVVLGVPAGMHDERPGEEGAMHLLEHMIYQDSQGLQARQRELRLAQLGGILGGHTHMNYTEFYETAAPAHVPEMAARLLEQVFHPALREEQLAAQIQAVAAERAARLAGVPGNVLPWPHLLGQCWDDHAHAHDGSGDADLQGRITAGALRELHDRHYNPSAAVLLASGPAPAEQALADLARAAAGYRGVPGRPAPATPAIGRCPSVRTLAVDGLARPRLLAATPGTAADRVTDELLGDQLCAAGLALLPLLDASAGMFGPGDLTADDLFVIVDDSDAALSPQVRLAALQQLGPPVLQRAVDRALFTAERLVHDEVSRARVMTRDLLLRGGADFSGQLVTALAALRQDVDRARTLLGESARRLSSQPWHQLQLVQSIQESR